LAVALPLVAALINAAAARAQTETQKPDWLLILKVLPLLGVSAVHPIRWEGYSGVLMTQAILSYKSMRSIKLKISYWQKSENNLASFITLKNH